MYTLDMEWISKMAEGRFQESFGVVQMHGVCGDGLWTTGARTKMYVPGPVGFDSEGFQGCQVRVARAARCSSVEIESSPSGGGSGKET